MNQSLHLLVVDTFAGQVMASWLARRWLLPVVTVPERARIAVPLSEWAANIRLHVQFVGQWLGVLSPTGKSLDWLVVMRADGQASNLETSGLSWHPTRQLASSAGCIDYQRWALDIAAARSVLPSVAGPFGTCSWLDAVTNWVDELVGAPVVDVTTYRTTAYEVAARFTMHRERLFFKGLSADRSSEAEIASALHDCAPNRFPRSFARQRQTDGSVWWLTEECEGRPLVEGLTVADAASAAAACACAQREIGSDSPCLKGVPRVSGRMLADWATAFLHEPGLFAADNQSGAIERAGEEIDNTKMAEGFIPEDVDPGNLLVHGEEVRFIDLGEVHIGPRPLVAAMLAARCVGAVAGEADRREVRAAILLAYEAASRMTRLKGLWPALELAAAVFEAQLGWRRVQSTLQRGEVRGIEPLARLVIRQRIERAVMAYARDSYLRR